MMTKFLSHKFVEFIPQILDNGILYVSMEYGTGTHLCCCGCGSKVVTPLGPTDWKLSYDGLTISLYPSVGNWNLECKSHYWITDGVVEWARQWSKDEIEHGRKRDRTLKQNAFSDNTDLIRIEMPLVERSSLRSIVHNLWIKFLRCFQRKK